VGFAQACSYRAHTLKSHHFMPRYSYRAWQLCKGSTAHHEWFSNRPKLPSVSIAGRVLFIIVKARQNREGEQEDAMDTLQFVVRHVTCTPFNGHPLVGHSSLSSHLLLHDAYTLILWIKKVLAKPTWRCLVPWLRVSARRADQNLCNLNHHSRLMSSPCA
jgi:hypothetical protein